MATRIRIDRDACWLTSSLRNVAAVEGMRVVRRALQIVCHRMDVFRASVPRVLKVMCGLDRCGEKVES